ncbi:uncharacterized protein KZ484_011332 [Pholidichthys leucotaenia]
MTKHWRACQRDASAQRISVLRTVVHRQIPLWSTSSRKLKERLPLCGTILISYRKIRNQMLDEALNFILKACQPSTLWIVKGSGNWFRPFTPHVLPTRKTIKQMAKKYEEEREQVEKKYSTLWQ